MRLEVLTPFSLPHLASFRKGEQFECPDKEAKELLDGKLVKPVSTLEPELAVSASQRSKK